MQLKDVQAFHRTIAISTTQEKADFSKRLMALHDGVISYDDLVARLPTMDKAEAKALYAKLEEQAALYPAAVVYTDPVFGKPYLCLRAKIEHFRGLKRDIDGRILLTVEDHQAKADQLRAKVAEALGEGWDESKTYGPWVEGAKKEIAYHTAFVEGRDRHAGFIMDFVKAEG